MPNENLPTIVGKPQGGGRGIVSYHPAPMADLQRPINSLMAGIGRLGDVFGDIWDKKDETELNQALIDANNEREAVRSELMMKRGKETEDINLLMTAAQEDIGQKYSVDLPERLRERFNLKYWAPSQHIQSRVDEYMNREMTKAELESTDALITQMSSQCITDPGALTSVREGIVEAIGQKGALLGWDRERLGLEIGKTMDLIHMGQVKQFLKQGQVSSARRVLTDHGDDMSPGKREECEVMVKDAELDEKIFTDANLAAGKYLTALQNATKEGKTPPNKDELIAAYGERIEQQVKNGTLSREKGEMAKRVYGNQMNKTYSGYEGQIRTRNDNVVRAAIQPAQNGKEPSYEEAMKIWSEQTSDFDPQSKLYTRRVIDAIFAGRKSSGGKLNPMQKADVERKICDAIDGGHIYDNASLEIFCVENNIPRTPEVRQMAANWQNLDAEVKNLLKHSRFIEDIAAECGYTKGIPPGFGPYLAEVTKAIDAKTLLTNHDAIKQHMTRYLRTQIWEKSAWWRWSSRHSETMASVDAPEDAFMSPGMLMGFYKDVLEQQERAGIPTGLMVRDKQGRRTWHGLRVRTVDGKREIVNDAGAAIDLRDSELIDALAAKFGMTKELHGKKVRYYFNGSGR